MGCNIFLSECLIILTGKVVLLYLLVKLSYYINWQSCLIIFTGKVVLLYKLVKLSYYINWQSCLIIVTGKKMDRVN